MEQIILIQQARSIFLLTSDLIQQLSRKKANLILLKNKDLHYKNLLIYGGNLFKEKLFKYCLFLRDTSLPVTYFLTDKKYPLSFTMVPSSFVPLSHPKRSISCGGTMRGVKKSDSKIIDGHRLYYNFIKPHESLDGKTPSEEAGITLEGDNKWVTLIRNAVKFERAKEVHH